MHKSRLIYFLASLLPVSSLAMSVTRTVVVSNPLDISRSDCPVSLSLIDLCPQGRIPTSVVVMDGDAVVPCQIDDLDQDGVPEELAFVIDINANASKQLTITIDDEQPQAEYAPRVWAGFKLRGPKKDQMFDIESVTVPGHVNFYNAVHGHGPMFESELVGYRVYFNQKQTLDPYGKFNKRLELQETSFYPNDDQIAAGYGDDVLLAGNSCGVGAFKGFDGTKATHIEPVRSRTERIVANGPVRTVVEVEVKDWMYNGHPVDLVNRYTLYAGHRDLQVDARLSKHQPDDVFATGVERIMGAETQRWSDHDGLVASWGRHWPVTDTVKYAKETIGIATFVPKQYIVSELDDDDNFLYTVSPRGDDMISYYTMFTSRKETFGYRDADAWFVCLPAWKESLMHPLEVLILPLE